MANDEGIGGSYRISGVRNVGPAHVFPKSRVVRKTDKEYRESTKKPKEKRSPETPEEKEEGIDITV
ncbi:MAG: hypothetical protein M1510_10760 [Nitrospirae bacterium]|nr:hypothetical protein [Nitrospirota bacterium]MCL5237204.1 hypothetical protein [Nitrospirota bacterium]